MAESKRFFVGRRSARYGAFVALAPFIFLHPLSSAHPLTTNILRIITLMKLIAALCFLVTLSSCAGGWTEEDKKLFRRDCVEQVKPQLPEDKTNTYCDCFTEQMVKIYPVFNDAMEHHDSAKLEEAKAHCRKEIGMQ